LSGIKEVPTMVTVIAAINKVQKTDENNKN